MAKKGFGELFTDSWKEFGDKLVDFIKIYGLFYLLPAVIIIIFGSIGVFLTMFVAQDAGDWVWAITIPLLIILAFILIFFFIIYSWSLIEASLSKKSLKLSEYMSRAKKSFWKYLGFIIVMVFFTICLYLLLVIPGIIFSVYWVFAMFFLVGKDMKILESLGASFDLVRGRWWRVFGYGLLLLLIAMPVLIISAFIPGASLVLNFVIGIYGVIFFKNLYLDLLKNKK